MKTDTICCYCISKYMKKEAESLLYRLTSCEVGIFKTRTLSKMHPTTCFKEPLKFISHAWAYKVFKGSVVMTPCSCRDLISNCQPCPISYNTCR